MAFSYLVITDVFFAFLVLFIVRRFLRDSNPPIASLPPGPKGLPIVGNILDMPSQKEWLTFAKWGEQYGELSHSPMIRIIDRVICCKGGICSVTLLGQTLIILNSAELAVEMLEKKSSIYSDRPILQMGGELVGWKNTLVLLPYGDRFRRFRRLFHRAIGSPATLKQFIPLEELETHNFLRRIMAKPADVATHIRR